jgi:hypothetical protein
MKDQHTLLDNAPLLMGLLDDLAVYYRQPAWCTDLLLLMQVTDSACSGFVVGVT